jgi:hypothetical protein
MRLINKSILGLLIGGMGGCSGGILDWTNPPSPPNTASTFASNMASSAESYTALPMVGALSMVGGVVLLFVTMGKRGWLPLVIGVSLVVLNIIIIEYLHAVAIPLVVLSGLIGLAWTVKIIRDLYMGDGHGCKSDKSV